MQLNNSTPSEPRQDLGGLLLETAASRTHPQLLFEVSLLFTQDHRAMKPLVAEAKSSNCQHSMDLCCALPAAAKRPLCH